MYMLQTQQSQVYLDQSRVYLSSHPQLSHFLLHLHPSSSSSSPNHHQLLLILLLGLLLLLLLFLNNCCHHLLHEKVRVKSVKLLHCRWGEG